MPLRIDGDDGFPQPVVDIFVDGGESVPVAVDTGSSGLTLPLSDIPLQSIDWAGIDWLSNPIGFGSFAGASYVSLELPAMVDFGNGIATDETSVNAVLFSFPNSLQATQSLTGIDIDGILGIGPNAFGGGDNVTTDLPGELGDGVLVNEPGGALRFGPEPDEVDGLAPVATLAGLDDGLYEGVPFVGDLQFQIGDGELHDIANAVFDTGGKSGLIPADYIEDDPMIGDLLFGFGNLPTDTQISVYTDDGDTLLYSYTTPDTPPTMSLVPDYLPKPLGDTLNTGNTPFEDAPIYISNTADGGSGAMTIYGPPTTAG